MSERLNKIRKQNPHFNEEFVDYFSKIMPKLSEVMFEGCLYDNHIGTKEIALLAEPYIKNDKGEHIGFKWTYDEVLSLANNFINLDDAEFYPCDLWVWANVKYGDLKKSLEPRREEEIQDIVIKYAISELTDTDFPYYPASQRAYCWLKKHIENQA